MLRLALAVLLLPACAGEAPAGTAGGAGGAGGVGAAGTAGAGAAGAGAAGGGGAGAAPCPAAAGEVCVDRVKGAVHDEEHRPLGGVVVSVCGAGCFVGQTDKQGAFSVRVESPVGVDQYALLVHGRRSHASLYLRLPPLSAEVLFAEPIVAPSFAWVGGPLPAGAAAQVAAGPLSLSIAEGTEIELDIDDDTAGQEGRRLRAVELPLPPSFAPGSSRSLALAPFGAKFSKPVAVSLEAPPGLTEGQPLEWLVMDDDLLADEGNRAGLPRVAATGRVEGGMLRTDPGQGIDRLTWLAVRAAP